MIEVKELSSWLIRKIYDKVKVMYKSFVVMISGDMVDSKKMYGFEKQINDVMELIGLYLNQ